MTPEIRKKIGDANRGKKRTQEVKDKLSLVWKGRHHTEETKRKMSIAQKGRIITLEAREKLRKAHLGKKASGATKMKLSLMRKGRIGIMLGKHHTLESRLKMSAKRKGKNNANWQGGKSTINETLRKSMEYRLWREAVFKRDKYVCVLGGKKHGNKLEADHIKPFSLYPELRFAIDNGRTLCKDCHLKTDTWGGRICQYQYLN